MFVKQRPDLLKFINRNQKKKSIVSTQGTSENTGSHSEKQEVQYDALSQLLVQEVKAIQEQQEELGAKLQFIQHQNEAHDFLFQKDLNRYYHRYYLRANCREQEEKIGNFVVFMLNQYLAQNKESISPLRKLFP